MMGVEAGKKAPDFTAPADGGKKLKLSDLALATEVVAQTLIDLLEMPR